MMQVWDSVGKWQDRRRDIGDRSLGFVPTMGALHRGHASLVERCRAENELVVVSIFVNPTQFNDPRDLERYPRTLDRDLPLLESLGVDEVLAPSAADFYPHGYRYRVEPTSTAPIMEAAHRPGFIQGVLTVVMKLLNVVRARRAYFGEKDFQQLRTVSEMVEEFFVPTEIVACTTVRAESGLAESSRNGRLSQAGREKAAALYRALTQGTNPNEAKRMLEAEGLTVEYVEEHWGRRLAAVFLEGVRLIDNVAVNPDQGPRP
jgi:pantoate--beta-alanine ligase